MLFLWLINQLGLLTFIMFMVLAVINSEVDPNSEHLKAMSQHTSMIVFGIAFGGAIILAIPTAIFAKRNYYEMLSNGFLRWTSTIALWQSEWKFFFKTLFCAFLFYGITLFLGGNIVCALLGIK